MGGKEKAAKVSATKIAMWAIKGASSLWTALGPVWHSFTALWDVLRPVWDVVEKAFGYIHGSVTWLYDTVIDPLVKGLATVNSYLNDVTDWIDKVYNQTIGRVEWIYDQWFGKITDLYLDIEEATMKIARVAGIFSKDLGESIIALVDDVRASTIGRVEGYRDELLGKIDEAYVYVRDKVNDAYYALQDYVTPFIDKANKLGDAFDISFEKPDLLSKETIVKSADTYGQEWLNTIHEQGLGTREEKVVHGTPPPQIRTFIDDQVDDVDLGLEGVWSDVVQFIEDNVKALDAGENPTGFNIDVSLLPEYEREEIGSS